MPKYYVNHVLLIDGYLTREFWFWRVFDSLNMFSSAPLPNVRSRSNSNCWLNAQVRILYDKSATLL